DGIALLNQIENQDVSRALKSHLRVRSTTPPEHEALLSDPASKITRPPVKKATTAASESSRSVTATKKPRIVRKPKSQSPINLQ
ncbi:hypothetical protein PTTG_30075, partial [Puccinia triticina 1-1 BBBD Race 1]